MKKKNFNNNNRFYDDQKKNKKKKINDTDLFLKKMCHMCHESIDRSILIFDFSSSEKKQNWTKGCHHFIIIIIVIMASLIDQKIFSYETKKYRIDKFIYST